MRHLQAGRLAKATQDMFSPLTRNRHIQFANLQIIPGFASVRVARSTADGRNFYNYARGRSSKVYLIACMRYILTPNGKVGLTLNGIS